jgi:hypothetical protein
MTRLTNILEPVQQREQRTTVSFPANTQGSIFQGWGPKA